MNGASIHLMTNHLPVVGVIFSIMTICYALYSNNEGLKKWSLILTVVVGIFSFAPFLSGEPAEEVVEDLPGVSEKSIHRHEEAAELSFYTLEAVALASLAILLFYRREAVPRNAMLAVLIASLLASALMFRAAHLGGKIRHPELAPSAQSKSTV